MRFKFTHRLPQDFGSNRRLFSRAAALQARKIAVISCSVAVIAIICGLWATNQIQPVASRTFVYQGRVVSQTGTPINELVAMRFGLYASDSGGKPLWEEHWHGANAVALSDGMFSIVLGSHVPLNAEIDNYDQLWLSTEVGDDPAAQPRVQLGSVKMSGQPPSDIVSSSTSADTTKRTVFDEMRSKRVLGTVEMYDPEQDAWFLAEGIKSRYVGRIRPQAIHDGRMYMVGSGGGGLSHSFRGEVWKFEEGIWKLETLERYLDQVSADPARFTIVIGEHGAGLSGSAAGAPTTVRANHTCAILSSGSVNCWGHNQSGMLGDIPETQPVPFGSNGFECRSSILKCRSTTPTVLPLIRHSQTCIPSTAGGLECSKTNPFITQDTIPEPLRQVVLVHGWHGTSNNPNGIAGIESSPSTTSSTVAVIDERMLPSIILTANSLSRKIQTSIALACAVLTILMMAQFAAGMHDQHKGIPVATSWSRVNTSVSPIEAREVQSASHGAKTCRISDEGGSRSERIRRNRLVPTIAAIRAQYPEFLSKHMQLLELTGSPSSGHVTEPEFVTAMLVTQGMTDVEIANYSGYSVHAIDSHLRALREKLDAANRAELVSMVYEVFGRALRSISVLPQKLNTMH